MKRRTVGQVRRGIELINRKKQSKIGSKIGKVKKQLCYISVTEEAKTVKTGVVA